MNHMRVIALLWLPLLCGCTAPFSDFQSARTAGTGQAEFTTSYSSVTTSDGKIQDQAGFQVALGIRDHIDLRGRYEYIWFDSDIIGHVNVAGFGPKFSLKDDRAAFYVPVGFAFGEDVESSETWEIHPTLIVTQPVSAAFEINFSLKALIDLSGDGQDARVAANVGAGIGPEITWFILRPEVGAIISTGGGDPVYHFGVGVSLATEGKKRSGRMGR